MAADSGDGEESRLWLTPICLLASEMNGWPTLPLVRGYLTRNVMFSDIEAISSAAIPGRGSYLSLRLKGVAPSESMAGPASHLTAW